MAVKSLLESIATSSYTTSSLFLFFLIANVQCLYNKRKWFQLTTLSIIKPNPKYCLCMQNKMSQKVKHNCHSNFLTAENILTKWGWALLQQRHVLHRTVRSRFITLTTSSLWLCRRLHLILCPNGDVRAVWKLFHSDNVFIQLVPMARRLNALTVASYLANPKYLNGLVINCFGILSSCLPLFVWDLNCHISRGGASAPCQAEL